MEKNFVNSLMMATTAIFPGISAQATEIAPSTQRAPTASAQQTPAATHDRGMNVNLNEVTR